MPTTAMKRAVFLLGSALASELKLATFDGAEATKASWRDLNDPVMGGASTSTFKTTTDKTGLFNGTCAIVGFLKAPGFAKIVGSATFADITGYDSIALRVKSSTPDYQGFKVAFAAPGIPKTSMFGGSSYKAGFNLTGSHWQLVEVPLTQFSYDWSGYTGQCDTKDPAGVFSKGSQHYCCSKSGLQPSKPEVCVDSKFLSKINSVEVWAEGVKGDFNIEIDWIGASKKSLNSAPGSHTCPPANFSSVEKLDLDAYADGRWYIHQQMAVTYLPKTQNRCVYAEYTKKAKKSFWGYDIGVHNYAEDVAPPHAVHDSGSLICAKVVNANRGQLEVAPCFLPTLAAGPYWVLAFDALEGYALVSGGPPKTASANGCVTGTGVNGSGLWIFSRSQKRDEGLIQKVRDIAQSKGFDLSVLNDVDQSSCDAASLSAADGPSSAATFV